MNVSSVRTVSGVDVRSLVVPVALAFGLLAGCTGSKTVAAGGEPGKQAVEAIKPIAVSVATAESRRLERAILVTGALYADETVTISSELIGRVISIRKDFGQSFRKGEILAEIDPQEYQIQLERNRAALAQALARLGLKPGEENTPPDSTPAIRQSQAQMEDAKFKFESAAKLVKTGDISQDRFNEIEKSYRARAAALEMSRDEMRTQWMSMESIKSDVKLYEKRLRDATLRAPFDGTVSQKHVSPGQYLRENAPILTIVKTNPLRLRIDVPEVAAGVMHIGSRLSFTTDAIPGAQFQAVIQQLNPSLDARSRSLQAEARLVVPDARLRPGMFAQIRLVLARDAEVVMVPKRALYTIAGLTKVFVIRESKAVEVRANAGDELDGWVELPGAGLRAGDQVAVNAQAALVSGSPVTASRFQGKL